MKRLSTPALLFGVVACLLTFKIVDTLTTTEAAHQDVALATVLAPQPQAPADVSSCAARYDGKRVQTGVTVRNVSTKRIESYTFMWKAYDKADRVRARVSARYAGAHPLLARHVATSHLSIDILDGLKLSMLDHLTCRLTHVGFAGDEWSATP